MSKERDEYIPSTTFRYARIPIDLTLLGQILGLPDGMEVVAPIAMDDPRHVEIYVRSAHLPAVVPGDKIPRIMPIYQRVETGKATLLRIDGYDGPLTRTDQV